MQHFTLTTVIHASRERVFHFHDDPENLVRITPTNIRVSVERFDTPGPGAMVVLKVIPFPLLRTTWEMKISRYKPTEVFEDTMISGPFAYWKHLRTFEGDNERTVLTESVQYKLPFGFLGRLADALFVGRKNRRMFAYRQQRMAELLEAAC